MSRQAERQTAEETQRCRQMLVSLITAPPSAPGAQISHGGSHAPSQITPFLLKHNLITSGWQQWKSFATPKRSSCWSASSPPLVPSHRYRVLFWPTTSGWLFAPVVPSDDVAEDVFSRSTALQSPIQPTFLAKSLQTLISIAMMSQFNHTPPILLCYY